MDRDNSRLVRVREEKSISEHEDRKIESTKFEQKNINLKN